MALKLFLISLSMIFLFGVSQANSFLENANLLHRATEAQRITFFRTSFKSYDANKDGFVTHEEFANVESETLPSAFASLINVGMRKALNKFDREGGKWRQIGIDLEDYKRSMKEKLGEVSNASKRTGLSRFYVSNKYRDFLAFFAIAQSKIDQIA